MPDIQVGRETYIMVSDGSPALYPSPDLYPATDLYPQEATRISNIVEGTMDLDELLCDGELKFGQMCSTKFEVTVYDTVDIGGKYLSVYQQDDGAYHQVFTGVVDSAKLDRLGTDRQIVAYDYAYAKSRINIASWWDTFWANRTSSTLKQLRDSLLEYADITYEDVVLINDNITVTKTVNITSMAFNEMLRMVCEISCAFPHFNRDGILEFIMLETETTARSLETLYEGENSTFEDYTTQNFTGIQFYGNSSDLQYVEGTSVNPYSIHENILLYNMDNSQLHAIGANMLDYISDISYKPSSVKMIISDWTYGLGERVSTEKGGFYILHQAFNGMQLIEQIIEQAGSESQHEVSVETNISDLIKDTEMDSIGEDIENINEDVDGLEGEIADLDEKIDGVEISLKHTVDGLESRVAKSQREWDTTGYNIYAYGYEAPTNSEYPPSEYSGKYYLNQTNGALYYCNGSSWSYYTSFQTIQASLESEISQTADQISLKVSKGDVSSQLSVESGQITLSSGRLVINSGNFTLDSSGNATATNFIANRWVQVNSGSSGYVYLGGDSGGKLAVLSSATATGNNGWSGSYGGLKCGSITCIGNITLDPGCHVYEYSSNYSLQQYATQTWVSNNFASDLELSSVQTVAGNAYNNANTAIADAYNAQTTASNAYSLASNALTGVSSGGRESGTGKYMVHSVYQSGSNVMYTTMEVTGASDSRLKIDIKPLDDFTDFYMELKVYKFKYNPKLEATRMRDYVHYGIMAQDTMELYDKYGIPSEDISLFYKEKSDEVQKELTGEDTYWSMNRDELHALHIQMIQKQQRQIDAQQKEIDELKNAVKELKEVLNAYQQNGNKEL